MLKNELKRYIDLHIHLDGAITVEIAKRLAQIQGIKLPLEDDEELLNLLSVPSDCTSLNDFLECFALPCSLIQSKQGISEAVYLISENMKKQGIIYAEIRFAPSKCMDKGLTQEEAVQAALEGLNRTDLKVNLILCCMRGADTKENRDINRETIEVAKKYLVKDGGVVAVDLAGAEVLFPNEYYIKTFALAREYGIPFTIHAGEAAGADSVKSAIEMGAARVGHGVRLEEDEELLKLVRDRQIPLEMCPTSNSQTRAVESMDNYPLIRYLDMGLMVTLNTDDPAIERTDIASEYQYMQEKFGLTAEQKKQLLLNAVHAAFTSDEVKDKLRQMIY